MPTLENILNADEWFIHSTGGNCKAHFHELNTNGDYILVASEYSLLTEHYAQDITICVYLHEGQEITFEVENLDLLDSRLAAIYELWGY